MNWPADHVERRPLAELIPYAKNARTHSPEQIAQVAASMREWGWTNPVLIDEDGTIIAGHARVMAAQSLGFADVPVMIARGWSDAQKRAYVIADNKLGSSGRGRRSSPRRSPGASAIRSRLIPFIAMSR